MTKRTTVMVEYNSYREPDNKSVAKFSDYSDAIHFAENQYWAEVWDKTGILGQFKGGEPTEEFRR